MSDQDSRQTPNGLSIEFPAPLYSRFRPEYPSALYDLMQEWMKEAGARKPGTVADLGCGTGQATVGLMNSSLASQILAVEPDPRMLDEARAREGLDRSGIRFVNRPAEDTGLSAGSVDAILCACAFHWMKRDSAVREFLRILARPGLIFFAEYSFPRSSSHPEFDQWIRAKLRGEWQIPELRDRESFEEMVSVFGRQPGVRELGRRPVPMLLRMTWRETVGLIQSQSRYFRYREKLADGAARAAFDREVEARVHEFLGDGVDVYDYQLKAVGFAAESLER